VTELRVFGDCETVFASPPFPLPPAIRQIDTGTCRIAHLGRSAFYAEQDISFATGSSTSADVRFTAANGDVLRATSVGVFVPNGSRGPHQRRPDVRRRDRPVCECDR
jgi:hypothetical protein